MKTVTRFDLPEFVQAVGLDQVAQGRYSWLFALQLLLYVELQGGNPYQVVEEIKGLEGGTTLIGTKPAAQFIHAPLKGLWHKHFFCARFIPKNILNALSGGRLSALVDDIFDSEKSPIVTPEMIRELSHRVVHETMRIRQAQNRLTGEWIVFARHGGRNYYLTLSTHNTRDQVIYSQIETGCFPQFPFLKATS